MSDLSNVARPYAQAVFELASENNDLATWGDQLDLLSAIASNEDLQAMLTNPAFTAEQQISVFLDVGGDKLSDAGKNLVRLLVENDRVEALPEMSAIFAEKRAEAERVIEADMITASAVAEEQQQAFSKALEARLGRSVNLNFEVDSSLIGGAVIRAGDWVVDGSVKAQLEQLEGALAA